MRGREIVSILPPLASTVLYTVGTGIIHTLLPLRLKAAGYSDSLNGLIAVCYAGGFLCGCLVNARLVRAVGHIRAYAAAAAAVSVTVLALDLGPPILLVALLQVAGGYAAAVLAMVVESWLNESVEMRFRGQLMTIYMICLASSWALGQYLCIALDPAGSGMLVLTAGFMTIALVPVTVAKVVSPTPPKSVRVNPFAALRASPTGALSCLFTGLVSATFASIGPLYGAAQGLGQTDIIVLMMTAQAGGLVLQWPLGYLSDNFGRNRVLTAMAMAITLVAAGVLSLGTSPRFAVLAPLFALFGGLAESFYPIGVAHANDRASAGDYVGLSSNLLFVWGFGGTIGPAVTTFALEKAGPSSFFWYVLALSLSLAAFTLVRSLDGRRRLARRREFRPLPQTTPAVFEWRPPPDEERRNGR